MKNISLLLWIILSIIYLFHDLSSIQFLNLRINIWLQMNAVAFILATTGAILQNILQNPIADPWILGVSGASSLSTVIVSLLHLSPILFWRTTGALVGSSLVIFCLVYISRKIFSNNVSKFILVGIGINAFCSALMIFLQNLASPNDFFSTLVRISGHFSQRSLWELILLCIAIAILSLFLTIRKKELAILAVGDELSFSVGISVNKIKIEALIVCSITLAIAVSISGNIGFLGLAVPHVIRMLFGEKNVLAIDLLFIGSGILIICAGLLVKLMPVGVFIPIGASMALIGSPIFLYILFTQLTD